MYVPNPARLILLLLLPFLCACKNDKVNDLYDSPETSAGALGSFKKAREVKTAGEKIEHLNSALLAIENRRDTLLPLLLDYKVYYHNNLKEYDSSLYFADSLIGVAEFQKDTANLALGYYRKAKINSYKQDQEAVFSNNFEARRYYLAIKDSSNAGRRTLEMAIAQSRSGDYAGSQETATEAFRLLNREKDSRYLSSTHNVIAMVYHEQNFYDDAVKEYQNALALSSSINDSLSILNNLALVFMDRGNYSEAIALWNELLEKSDSNNQKARYLDNLAYAKWTKDSTFSAENDLLTAFQLRQEKSDREGLLASYDHLSEYYRNLNPELSAEYSEKLLALARDIGNVEAEFIALERLIPISGLPQTRVYSERYMRLNDSVQTAALKAKNSFAKIRFDEERKQQEIFGLKAQNAIQALATQRLQTRSLIGFLIASLFILGLFFLFYYFRQRHKKEKVREVHQTESRISKVIHDELANDIFNVMSSLEPLAPTTTIDKLEKIYLRTRDISRENSEIDTGENYPEDLMATLTNNAPDQSKLILKGENSVTWEKLGEEKKIVIYRILQELMINMKKHSEAGLVAIIFSQHNKTLKINYSDNGVGMAWKSSNKRNGLQNVENRIISLNGRITFESEEGKGFKVVMQIPL